MSGPAGRGGRGGADRGEDSGGTAHLGGWSQKRFGLALGVSLCTLQGSVPLGAPNF